MIWPAVRLDNVCEKITDGTHRSPTNGSTGDFKYVTAKNIKPWGLDLTDVTYVDAATHREIYSRCDVRKNDVLYVKDGATTGRVALNALNEEFSLLSSVGVLRPGENIRPKYLLYALQAPAVLDRMLGDMAGVAIRRLTIQKPKESQIPLAPLDKQDEIVEEIETQFSRLEKAVAGLKRIEANIRAYVTAVLRSAVAGQLVEPESQVANRARRAYESGESLLARIANQPRKKDLATEVVRPAGSACLPEGWAWTNGAMLFRWSSGRNLPVRELAGGEVPVYGGNGINGWHSVANVKGPTLVVGRVGAGCGNVHVVRGEAWITDNAIYAIETPYGCDLSYLALSLTVADLNSVAAGSGQPFVNQTILNETPIALPPTAEQRRIVAEVDRRLSIVRELEAEVDANLKRAQALRQATLAKAFSGDHA